ncbi:MAG: sugar phosphate isomerase/epimerase [Planctomycetota bacterium]|nr:MAG: sugar phosphate isomerase/epimerase [Planctomycetota bacterium]
MFPISRRRFNFAAAVMATGGALQPLRTFASDPASAGCTLGFSTYGMKDLSTEDALRCIASVGFDSVEIVVRDGWDFDSASVDRERRARIRSILNETGLKLAALMEHVFPAPRQQAVLERLRLAADLAHELAPQAPPLVQTVLGNGVFEEQKTMLRDALGAWAEVARQTGTTIAIKPHRGGVVSQPAEAIWLLEQVGAGRWLRMVYDYSHYAFRGLDLTETISQALPYTAHVAVKDAVQEGTRVVFRLPGSSGTIDYPHMFRQFFAGGYRGDFNCEVSGMVWSQAGYDPVSAAQQCYRAMRRAFVTAGVPRVAAGRRE